MSQLIPALIEKGTLEAVASRYPDLYETDPESAEDFACDLINSWWTAHKYASQEKEARERLPQLNAAMSTLLDAEAERRFPEEYAVGGQAREEARDKAFEHFWIVSSLSLTADMDVGQLEKLEMKAAAKELASRQLPGN